jgi:hypothetical protein
MHTSCLYSDIDWLIYADYLDDQNINHFIREDIANLDALWCYEYRNSANTTSVGINGVGGFGDNRSGSNCIGNEVGYVEGKVGGNYYE